MASNSLRNFTVFATTSHPFLDGPIKLLKCNRVNAKLHNKIN